MIESKVYSDLTFFNNTQPTPASVLVYGLQASPNMPVFIAVEVVEEKGGRRARRCRMEMSEMALTDLRDAIDSVLASARQQKDELSKYQQVEPIQGYKK